MIKKLHRWIVFLIFFTFFFILQPSSLIAKSETVKQDVRVDYLLPYPGLLYDHPLFFLKKTRDKMQLFLTRDYLKKAQLYLLYSDKKINTAQMMKDQKKYNYVFEVCKDAEKDFANAIKNARLSKKVGASASPQFVDNLKKSNQAHKNVYEAIYKSIPKQYKKNSKDIEILIDKNRNNLKLL